jgi:hypothetical protein
MTQTGPDVNGSNDGAAGPSPNGRAVLLPQHVADLERSGLTPATIREAGLHSAEGAAVSRLLNWRGGGDQLGACMAIPFFGLDGKTLDGYVRLKPDRPRTTEGGRIVKYESPRGRPSAPYFPPGALAALSDPTKPLWIVEGEKKSLAATQTGFPCVGLVGVYGWQRKRPRGAGGKPKGGRRLVPLLAGVAWQGRTVFICFDSDAATNDSVRWAEWHLAEALNAAGADVKIVRLPEGPACPDGKAAKVGVDDFLVAHGPEALRHLAAQAQAPTQPEDRRPEIQLSVEEHRAVEEAVEALAEGDPGLYQRGGLLVHAVRPPPAREGDRVRASGALRIEPVPSANLRNRLTRVARFTTWKKKKLVRARPAAWLVEGVVSAGEWPGVRPLEAVTESPVLRPDGSVLDAPGYDAATGLLYEPAGRFPPLPRSPTLDDARRAVGELLVVVEDFPFAGPVYCSAWLAALLTTLARFAFTGPSPFFLADANVRGAGKGLQLDCIALIDTGREFARASYTRDDDEMRKVITALALSGERMVNLDNLAGLVGGPALDAALTATEWQGRVLGRSETPRLPLLLTWHGSGNNVMLRADTARRTCQIRLSSPHERPEERAGFRHPDLLGWVRRERGRLLCAALTVLSAYCRAGRPDQHLKPWGSYEGWTALVRGAVVWSGLPDPGEARMTMAKGADREANTLAGLLAGWQELDPDGRGLTVRQALEMLNAEAQGKYPTMRGVLAEVFDLKAGQLPGSGALGIRLRSFAGRVCGGRYFLNEPTRAGVARWRVCGGESAGDEGDVGDVYPASRASSREQKGNTSQTSSLSPSSPAPDVGDGLEEVPL